jgi:hypothetical protein
MNELLKNYPDCLFEPEDSRSLASAIRLQLEKKTVAQIVAPSWADSAAHLNRFFENISGAQSSTPQRSQVGGAD